MGIIFRICMFITSFLPLWVSVVMIDAFSIYDGSPNLLVEKISILTILLVNTACLLYLKKAIHWAGKQRESPVMLLSAHREKSITSEYLLAYILPLFSFDFTAWRSLLLFCIFFATLCFLCVRNGNIYANILFELRKYSFYQCMTRNCDGVDVDMIVISHDNLCSTTNSERTLVSLGRPIFMDITSKL